MKVEAISGGGSGKIEPTRFLFGLWVFVDRPKTFLLIVGLWLCAGTLAAADLPTVSIEHLYYLQARAERVRRFKPEEMVNYCLALKIGGPGFEAIYAQLFDARTEVAKLTGIRGAREDDPNVVALRKTIDVYTGLLHEEAAKVEDGILHEGSVAADTLQAIARAQGAR